MPNKTPAQYLKDSLEQYDKATQEAYENNKAGKFAYHYDLYEKQRDASSNLAWAAKKVLDSLDG